MLDYGGGVGDFSSPFAKLSWILFNFLFSKNLSQRFTLTNMYIKHGIKTCSN
jgi:hypothetical protein